MLWPMPADTSPRRIGILFVGSTLAPRSPRARHGPRVAPCCGRLRRSTRFVRTSQTSETSETSQTPQASQTSQTSETSQTPAAVLLGENNVSGCLHCQRSLDLGRHLFA